MGQFVNNLKIGQRLAIGFGLMALALLAMFAVSWMSSQRVRMLSETELAAAQEDLVLSMSMRSELQRQDIAIRNAGLDSDPDSMQAQANMARAAAKKAAESLEALLSKPRNEKDVAVLEEIRRLNKDAVVASERALGMALSYQPEEAVKQISGSLQPISAKRSERVAAFEAEKRVRVQQAISSISAMSGQAQWLTAVSGLAGLTLAVVAAYLVTRSISRPLRGLVQAADQLADGDLTVVFPGQGRSEVAVLSAALRRMSDNLRSVIGTVQLSALETQAAANEIATGNRDLSERTESQAASLQGTVSSMTELSGAVQRNAESAGVARSLASQATDVARDGGTRVGEVSATMAEIAKSSKRISEIVGVIDGIAFQTNILALNAAVEAARAGDHGRGFAVVASEVRALSQRSASAAREIRGLIEANGENVVSGTTLVNAAAATMEEIVRSSSKVADIVAEISSVSSDQATSLGSVRSAMERIDEMTQQNSALVEEAAAAAGSLEQQTRLLNDTVGRFRMEQPG